MGSMAGGVVHAVERTERDLELRILDGGDQRSALSR